MNSKNGLNNGVWSDFPMAIGLSLIGLFIPYWFVANWEYPPRYSTHLLPLALLSVMIVLDYYLKRVPLFESRSNARYELS